MSGRQKRPRTRLESRLTDAELAVLDLLLLGLSNEQIGRKLKLATLTVKNHLYRIRKETKATSSKHLIVMVYQARIRMLETQQKAGR